MGRVVVFVGSMRKGGNTDLLAQAFVKGARKKNTVEVVSVADYQVNPCIACRFDLYSSDKRCIICDGGIMMDYITTKEAAAKWAVSDRRVLQYCTADRIRGAIKMGNTWLIPKDVGKPLDGRTKQGRKLKHE